MRVLPNMTVLAPADEVELRQCVRAAIELDGPVYIRIGKKGEKVTPKATNEFQIGRSITVAEGTDVCLISTGTVLPMVMEAVTMLADAGISARVESFHTVKPLDEGTLADVFTRFRVVAVIEEHSRLGGLGGSIAEWLARQNGKAGRMISFGTDDVFLHEIGTQDYARERLGLTAENVARGVREAVG